MRSSFCRLPFSWSSWRKLLHPTLSNLQGFGLHTVPQKQVWKIYRKFCAFLWMMGRNGVRRQRVGACRWTPCSWPRWRCTWQLPTKQNTNPNHISQCHGHAHHTSRTSRALYPKIATSLIISTPCILWLGEESHLEGVSWGTPADEALEPTEQLLLGSCSILSVKP